MNRLLGVLVLLLAGVVCLGFSLGWFHLSRESSDHKTTITVTVDQDKIQGDREKAKERLQEVGKKVKDQTGALTDKAKDEGRRP